MRFLFPLPDISNRAPDRARPASEATALGRYVLDGQATHPGKTGVLALSGGSEALDSRLVLADAAETSIDVQYYIWHDDISGLMLLDALDRAAARGVHVRLLLDDNGIPGLDGIVAALNAKPNFHIRLFNPSTLRRPKLLGYAFDFMRMNRRMHNKSFIVDGAVAIVGGRNIGDEYFEVGDVPYFIDLDVLAVGAIVPDTQAEFDAYWNSASVFEAETIVPGPGTPDRFAARVAETLASPAARAILSRSRAAASRYLDVIDRLEWTDVALIADDPAKGQGLATRDQLMITRLGDILGDITTRLDLISAYFIPGKAGNAFFARLAREGVKVNIMTNAMTTTDVILVHTGYTKYRRELLEAGVTLFELKPGAFPTSPPDRRIAPLGLSGASLHAKTFAIDGNRIFIGSFNFDPRSAMLNSEMGFLIDSPALASVLAERVDTDLARVTYRPALTPEDKMVWRETMPDGSERIYQQEPGANWLQQVALALIGLLPIEWAL